MLDYALRPLKDRVLIPVARPVGLRISPTAVTLLALATGLLAAGLLLTRQYGLALALWLTSRMLDGLDGTIARTHARQSDFGGYGHAGRDGRRFRAAAALLGRGALSNT